MHLIKILHVAPSVSTSSSVSIACTLWEAFWTHSLCVFYLIFKYFSNTMKTIVGKLSWLPSQLHKPCKHFPLINHGNHGTDFKHQFVCTYYDFKHLSTHKNIFHGTLHVCYIAHIISKINRIDDKV